MEHEDRSKCDNCILLPICEAEEIPYGDDACNPNVDPENDLVRDALERVGAHGLKFRVEEES